MEGSIDRPYTAKPVLKKVLTIKMRHLWLITCINKAVAHLESIVKPRNISAASLVHYTLILMLNSRVSPPTDLSYLPSMNPMMVLAHKVRSKWIALAKILRKLPSLRVNYRTDASSMEAVKRTSERFSWDAADSWYCLLKRTVVVCSLDVEF